MEENKEVQEAKPKLPFITIHMREDGNLDVHGEFSNLILAYGMLEVAKDFFRASVSKAAKIERVNGSGGLINHLRNGRF